MLRSQTNSCFGCIFKASLICALYVYNRVQIKVYNVAIKKSNRNYTARGEFRKTLEVHACAKTRQGYMKTRKLYTGTILAMIYTIAEK